MLSKSQFWELGIIFGGWEVSHPMMLRDHSCVPDRNQGTLWKYPTHVTITLAVVDVVDNVFNK